MEQRKKLPKAQIEAILREMNSETIFEPQPAIAHVATITGFNKVHKGAGEEEDTWSHEFIMATKAVSENLGSSSYIRGRVAKPVTATDGFDGDKKPENLNIFDNERPEMFEYFRKEIAKGNFTIEYKGRNVPRDKRTDEDRPRAILEKTVYGNTIAVNVPEYTPHRIDDNGKRVPLIGTKYDAFEKKMNDNHVAKRRQLTIFLDPTDVKNPINEIIKRFEREVEPYMVTPIAIDSQYEDAKEVKLEKPVETEMKDVG